MSARPREDRGFTLIELMVSSALLVLVLSAVGGMLISSMSAEDTVRDTTSAARSGQLAAATLTKGVRQARAVEVTTPFAGAVLVRTLIIDDPTVGSARAHCEAWVFAGGEIRTQRSATAIPAPVSVAATSGWTLLTSGVQPVAGRAIASANGAGVDIAFQVSHDDGPKALIETQAVSRQADPVSGDLAPLPAPLEEDQCF
ncbi:type II secretion system protein J [Lysobacter korlensis]|uniref:Type II secretion system protein J n=1 Tax=Lysobacter korlensis TaxID=553636 RepID=A0ABV6RUS4_9GAMM